MNAGRRACVAYIAGRLISGKNAKSVYDFGQSKYISISGTVDNEKVKVFDFDRSCHFSGSLPNLYDFGGNHHVQLKIDGAKFKGYDFGSGTHFQGTVDAAKISVYDFCESAHFHYKI